MDKAPDLGLEGEVRPEGEARPEGRKCTQGKVKTRGGDEVCLQLEGEMKTRRGGEGTGRGVNNVEQPYVH